MEGERVMAEMVVLVEMDVMREAGFMTYTGVMAEAAIMAGSGSDAQRCAAVHGRPLGRGLSEWNCSNSRQIAYNLLL